MYRLAGARSAYSSATCVYGSATGSAINGTKSAGWHSRISCSLCRIPGTDILAEVQSVRQQSTRTALENISKKRKFKKRKKYVELLEVNGTSSTETKASVNKLHADQLSQIASSSMSLNQLHKLNAPKNKRERKIIDCEVDYELLRSVENSLINKYETGMEERCALVFTNQEISSKFNDVEYIKAVKESYLNFKKLMIKDQKLKDLNFAINEGLNQEIEMDALLLKQDQEEVKTRKDGVGAHEVFRKYLQGVSAANKTQLERDPTEKMHLNREGVNTLKDGEEVHEKFRKKISQGVSTTSQPIEESTEIMDLNILDEITNFPSRGCSLQNFEEELVDEDIEIDLPSPEQKVAVQKSKEEILKMIKDRRTKKRERKEKFMKISSRELDHRGKEESLNKLLIGHMQLYCSNRDVDQGHKIIQYYLNRAEDSSCRSKITDPRIYNILMQGHADMGNHEKAVQVMSWMRRENIKMNVYSYSALFQAVENCEQCTEKEAILIEYQEQMNEMGITLNDLLDKCKFLYNQREVLLKAVRRLDPSFEPRYTPPELDYVCPLLEKLKLDNLPPTTRRSEVSGLLTADELYERGEAQLQNELNGFIEVKNIELSGNPSISMIVCRKKLAQMLQEWHGSLSSALSRNLNTLRLQSQVSQSAITLYPYLSVIPAEEMVQLMIAEVRKLADGSECYSPSVAALHKDLGYSIYNRYQIGQYRKNGTLDKVRLLYKEYCRWYAGEELEDVPASCNSRQVWQTLLHRHKEGACLDYEEHAWTPNVCQEIGKFLYGILINEVKINVHMFKKTKAVKKLPAIYKVYRSCGRNSRAELKPHPTLLRLYQKAATPTLRMSTRMAPLACPPEPWSRAGRSVLGAYLITPPPLIRMPSNVVSQWQTLESAPPASMYPPLDCLNQLGEVPWRVNTSILDLQLQVFRSGGSKELDICQPPSALDLTQFGPADSKATLFKQRLSITKAKAEMYSLWCDMLYKLSLANHYRDDIFWLPHNMDFRGRVYACCPHLSQLSSDTGRALLRFARAEPLGRDGLRWLKIHLVNLTGTMKRHTLDERFEYAESIMPEIVDSAENPLGGRRWWAKSDEPWQTLACCMEIYNAVKSGNPEEYRCSVPVHQDGSCNGLQHYAALGGDSVGAASVNLTPSRTPQDVYTAVANKVEAMRKRDAAQGYKPALALEGFVRRKVIKQTVMTTVYGVTRFGARLQIAKQLKDIDDFPKEMVWACSAYLTGKTFDSLTEMFTATKQIQDWFTDCARVISGVCGESVSWVTPLGLPVVQPYHKRRSIDLNKRTMGVAEQCGLDIYLRPDMTKQKNAFPPNFIHSLDSSHMMLTSLYCRAAGINFVSVHDCYWTHAADVDQMNKICREQFVALHSQPILENLSQYLIQRYGYPPEEELLHKEKSRTNKVLASVPPKGDFKLENVLKSVYFFS